MAESEALKKTKSKSDLSNKCRFGAKKIDKMTPRYRTMNIRSDLNFNLEPYYRITSNDITTYNFVNSTKADPSQHVFVNFGRYRYRNYKT